MSNSNNEQPKKPRSADGRFVKKQINKSLERNKYWNFIAKKQLNTFGDQIYKAVDCATFFVLFCDEQQTLEIYPSSAAVNHLETEIFNMWIQKHGERLWKLYKMSQHPVLIESFQNYRQEIEVKAQTQEKLLQIQKNNEDLAKQIKELEQAMSSTP
eukprot:67817_1